MTCRNALLASLMLALLSGCKTNNAIILSKCEAMWPSFEVKVVDANTYPGKKYICLINYKGVWVPGDAVRVVIND